MKILQCGYGRIGTILYNEFKSMADAIKGEINVYDPNKDCPNKVDNLNNHYGVAFVCVPTDKLPDGGADISIVLEVCRQIDADVIVVKSTIPIDIVSDLPEKVIFSPEYTGETVHNRDNNKFVVLGGRRDLCNIVAGLYQRIHNGSFEIVYTDIKTAILSKYMENCALALKVTFCNEIATACEKAGVNYDDVRNIWLKDSRFSPSHTIVFCDQPYYDSHCLNKDISAFNAQFDLPLMKTVESINEEMKSKCGKSGDKYEK